MRQQGRSSYLIHPDCCILGQVGPPEKQREILLHCGKEELWSTALMCWSSWSLIPLEAKSGTRSSQNLMSVSLLLGSSAPRTVRLDEFTARECSCTDSDWLKSMQAGRPSLGEGMGVGSQQSSGGDRREMFAQGNAWNLSQFRKTEFGKGAKLEQRSSLWNDKELKFLFLAVDYYLLICVLVNEPLVISHYLGALIVNKRWRQLHSPGQLGTPTHAGTCRLCQKQFPSFAVAKDKHRRRAFEKQGSNVMLFSL